MSGEVPRRKKFLFVDDDADFLAGVKEIFTGMARGSWEVSTAENHAQVLATLTRHPVDVVVLDVNMPVMDGVEFLRLLRRTHPGQQVVMLTANVSEETRRTCLDLGASLFLQKLLTPQGFEAVFAALDALADAVPQTGFHGMMRKVGLQDVLQMECLGRKSSILDIFSPRNTGRIYICDGDIVHAESGSLQGEVALYGLLALRGGEFNLVPFVEPTRRTISGHYEFLLMEAARLTDESASEAEAGAASASTGRPDTAATIPAGPLESESPAQPPAKIEEVVLCLGAGEVLYERSCSSIERRLNLLTQIEQQATQLSGILAMGRFDRLELLTENERIVCQVQSHMRLFVRSTMAGEENA